MQQLRGWIAVIAVIAVIGLAVIVCAVILSLCFNRFIEWKINREYEQAGSQLEPGRCGGGSQ